MTKFSRRPAPMPSGRQAGWCIVGLVPELRGEEVWAANSIALCLGIEVRQHDDGTKPGMHDLDVVAPDGSVLAAVEVTAAADAESIELWNLVNGGPERWIEPALKGGWLISLEPRARAKRLRQELPALLADLEARNVDEIGRPRRPRNRGVADTHQQQAAELGIVHGGRSDTEFPGSIYLTIQRSLERTGGFVDPTGAVVPPWVSNFLREPQQADVLRKLAASGAAERHVYVILPGFSTAPFGVTDMLLREDESVPCHAPDLPPEVTHVWLASSWSRGSGLKWSPDAGWQRFVRAF